MIYLFNRNKKHQAQKKGLVSMRDRQSLRYELVFRIIPNYYHHNQKEFLEGFLFAPARFLYEIFRRYDAQHGLKSSYSLNSFKEYRHEALNDGVHMVGASIPHQKHNATEICLGYCVVWNQENNSITDFAFYTIEEHTDGSLWIGTVDEDGVRHSFVETEENWAAIETKILDLYTGKEEPHVETIEKTFEDGSHSVMILNHSTGEFMYHKYDPNGTITESNYGRFG